MSEEYAEYISRVIKQRLAEQSKREEREMMVSGDASPDHKPAPTIFGLPVVESEEL